MKRLCNLGGCGTMINMPVEFETKKVPMETLGEYLSEVRKQLNLTLEEVAQKTGVYEKFIHYLEIGKYVQLPPDVYVLGFLKKLAKVYAVSSDALIDQYKKERGIIEHSGEKLVPVNSLKIWMQRITITPKLLTIASSSIVGIIALLYIVFQVFAINRTPALTITEPKPDTVIQGTSITVAGKTEPGITVSLNGQNIFVNTDGAFETTVGVAPGQKELRIEAQNKFGKKNAQMVALRVEETPSVAGVETTQPSELRLELIFTKRTTITVERDGVPLAEEIIPADSTKIIVAQNEIIITTSNAGSTQAMLNGEAFGFLGKEGQQITVPFTKEASELLGSPNITPTPINTQASTPTPTVKTTPVPTVKPKPTAKPTSQPTPVATPRVTPAAVPTQRVAPLDRG